MKKAFVLLVISQLTGCGPSVKDGDPKPADPNSVPPGIKQAGVTGPQNNQNSKDAKRSSAP